MKNNDVVLGEQAVALDKRISSRIIEADRLRIWESASNILDSYDEGKTTVLALGYVQ